MNNKKLRQLA
jgi:hypothetical protein